MNSVYSWTTVSQSCSLTREFKPIFSIHPSNQTVFRRSTIDPKLVFRFSHGDLLLIAIGHGLCCDVFSLLGFQKVIFNDLCGRFQFQFHKQPLSLKSRRHARLTPRTQADSTARSARGDYSQFTNKVRVNRNLQFFLVITETFSPRGPKKVRPFLLIKP